jgi:hypothetical protein
MTFADLLNEAETARPQRKRPVRRLVVIVVSLVIAVAVVVVGLVVADNVARNLAATAAESQISSRLPADVTGDFSVAIGGFSFLWQAASGSLDEVTITSTDLTAKGVPVSATVEASGVPTDFSKPIGTVTATFTLTEAAVNSFITLPGSSALTLGDGVVGYTGQVELFGLPLGYSATATVVPDGADVVVTPADVTVTAGTVSIDVGDSIAAVRSASIPICVAKYVPKDFTITELTVTPGQVVATATATNLVPSGSAIRTLGECA